MRAGAIQVGRSAEEKRGTLLEMLKNRTAGIQEKILPEDASKAQRFSPEQKFVSFLLPRSWALGGLGKPVV